MIRQLRTAFPILCLLAGPATPAPAQCETCEWADRGDRWEGVVPASERKPFSGGSFELLGVHYQHHVEAPNEGDRLYLSFWLPEPAELDEIEVWHPRARLHDYVMRAGRKSYGAGRQDFAWPRGAVIDPLGLAIGSLYARIAVGEVHYPALLSNREEPAPRLGYAFFFKSGAGIDASCAIVREESARVVRRFDCFEDVGGTIVIEWDGRDERGKSVPEGLFVLKVVGEMLAKTFRPLERDIAFWHIGRFEPALSEGEP